MEKKLAPTFRWPFRFKLNRDTNYYFGLALLVIASLSILWAVIRDGFDPKDFLIYFLVYMWGYVMLLKSDFDLRVTQLEHALKVSETRIDALTESLENEQTLDNTINEEPEEDFIPGLPGMEEMNPASKNDIYNEWTTD